MLRDRLARHVEMCTELPQCLAVLGPQRVQEESPGRVGKCLEYMVHIHTFTNMQPYTCMSSCGSCIRHGSCGIIREGGHAKWISELAIFLADEQNVCLNEGTIRAGSLRVPANGQVLRPRCE